MSTSEDQTTVTRAPTGEQGSRVDRHPARLRVLHLGFENPWMPNAGGGSVRTHAINKRLALEGHRITVLTTGYPDAAEAWHDGVHYVPIGIGSGRTKLSRLLGYVLRLPWEVRRRRDSYDLVVEDFFAPFSTMAAPLWTNKPTVGVVQWLHAKDKSREYGLPFHIIERAGVKTHHRMIAVSGGTAAALRAMNSSAGIEVIGNGLDPQALEIEPRLGRDVVYLGRLELPGKGLDLLLDAWTRIHQQVEGDLVIVGSGPNEEIFREMVQDSGCGERVRFEGWLQGAKKFAMLSNARLVVIPSRQETFGLVAIEALATGTPVIAFDIPCLREVIPVGSGWLVEPFDTVALATEIARRYNQPERLKAAGTEGRRFAARFDWDALAARQATAYRAALPPRSTTR